MIAETSNDSSILVNIRWIGGRRNLNWRDNYFTPSNLVSARIVLFNQRYDPSIVQVVDAIWSITELFFNLVLAIWGAFSVS